MQGLANRECGCAPPVAWVLFRPTRLRTGEICVLFRARREDRAVLIKDYGAGSTSSDIDAKDWNTASF